MATLNIKVITTYNNKLFKEYAHRFKETYNWPFELIVYNEDENILHKTGWKAKDVKITEIKQYREIEE